MLKRFDIFSGSPDKEPLWLGVSSGLDTAVERMEQRARTEPGRYFIHDAQNQAVVASIDTATDQKASVRRIMPETSRRFYNARGNFQFFGRGSNI
jgi:hypothetical protein